MIEQYEAGGGPVLAARHAGERFIRVMPLRDPATLEGGFLDVQACNDSNSVRR